MVVLKDNAEVHVVLVVRSGSVLSSNLVDDDFLGRRYFGSSAWMMEEILSSVSAFAVMSSTY